MIGLIALAISLLALVISLRSLWNTIKAERELRQMSDDWMQKKGRKKY